MLKSIKSNNQSGGITASNVNVKNQYTMREPPKQKNSKKQKIKWAVIITSFAAIVTILQYLGIKPKEVSMKNNKQNLNIISKNQSGGITANQVNIDNVNVIANSSSLNKEAPIINMVVKNEHRNYDDGADVFGVKWKNSYSSHTIEIKNMNKSKSIKQFSLVLGFNASIIYNNAILTPGAKGIKAGKDIASELQVTGPLFVDNKPETKVMPIRVANIFNQTVEEIFPEGSVTWRVILNSKDEQEIFGEVKYYYESPEGLRQKAFPFHMSKDQAFAKFPDLENR